MISKRVKLMDLVYVIFRVLFFAWVLFLPQFLGLLLHFRLRRFPVLASYLGFWLTIISSFFLLIVTLKPEQSANEVCGLGMMAVMMITLFFTTVQAVISAIAQFWFYRKYRT